MISKLVVFAGLGTVAALSASVFAQPAVTPSAAAAAEPTRYLEGGVALGGLEELITWGVGVEGGLRLSTSPLWLHASVSGGGGGERVAHGAGTYLRANAGPEARGCVRAGLVCFIGGADLGVTHGRSDGSTDLLGPASTMVAFDHPVVVPRIALDAGNSDYPRLRLRVTLDAPFDLDDLGHGGGAALSMAMGYAW